MSPWYEEESDRGRFVSSRTGPLVDGLDGRMPIQMVECRHGRFGTVEKACDIAVRASGLVKPRLLHRPYELVQTYWL